MLERNPYYFVIDKAGNQLPYIDKIRGLEALSAEIRVMQTVAGEIDYIDDSDLRNLPLYKENETKGGYRVVFLNDHSELSTVFLNLTYEDPVWREVVRDVRFRKALSIGANREEIINSVYLGFGSLSSEVPSGYNPAEANRLLDETGLDKRDKDGWRLGPDGKRFVIYFETSPWSHSAISVNELVVKQWKALGIMVEMKQIEHSLMRTRQLANQLQATILWSNDQGNIRFQLQNEAPLWELWIQTEGKEGEEPPVSVKRMYELERLKWQAVPHSPEHEKICQEMDTLKYENIWRIGMVKDNLLMPIVNSKLRNIPHTGYCFSSVFGLVQAFFEH